MFFVGCPSRAFVVQHSAFAGEEGVKMAWVEPVRGRRSRGRQRIRWRDRVKDDLERRGLVEEDAFERNHWRKSIRQPTP